MKFIVNSVKNAQFVKSGTYGYKEQDEFNVPIFTGMIEEELVIPDVIIEDGEMKVIKSN